MRLPRLDDQSINMDLVKQMVDAFMKQGFTYLY